MYPDYFSSTSMVTFREDLPYSVAERKGQCTGRLSDGVLSQLNDVSGVKLQDLHQRIKAVAE